MANIVSQNTSPTLNLKNIEDLGSTLVDRNFGRPEDYINIHIYDLNDNLLDTVENFKGYKSEQNIGGLIQDLNLDPLEILNELGYTTGTYNIKVNIQKRKIFNTIAPAFKIKEISSTRTEVKLTTVLSSNNINLSNNSRNFIQAVQNSTYFRDFILNFGKDRNVVAVNIALDTSNFNDTTLQIKLLEPLLENLKIGDKLSIAENIVDPIILTYDLGLLPFVNTTIPIKGPNFKIDTRLNSSVPTAFRSYDDILNTSTTSSYQKLVSKLEGYDIPEIDYGYVRPTDTASLDFQTITPTHFENFVHFGSATELLKNFEYKLKLIEVYNKQIHELNLISLTSLNTIVLESSSSITNKKENLIQGFSGYEQYLYFESGAYSWPKSGSHPQTEPYLQSHTTSSEASTWLGTSGNSITEGSGQLSSASIFDKQNPDRLMKLVPTFIGDREENQPFELFCDMVGEHFDPIWTHIKEITQTTDNSHKLGVSKNLVYYTLQNLGIEAYDQFENEDLINYIFGQSMVTNDTSTVITGSNETFAKQDITKEIWKRLYHNAPYLLKTKGTERGLRALINCYGVPDTVLDIKEFGSSDPNRENFKLYTYNKFNQILTGDSAFKSFEGDKKGMFIETSWTSSNTNAIILKPSASAKTVEFRIKPTRSGSDAYHLFSLTNHTSQSLSGSDLHLVVHPYTGSHDFFTVNDRTQYGKLDLLHFTSSILTSSGHQIISPVELVKNGIFNDNFGAELATTVGIASNDIGTGATINSSNSVTFTEDAGFDFVDKIVKQSDMISGRQYRASATLSGYSDGTSPFDGPIGFGAFGGISSTLGEGRINSNGTISHNFISDGTKINIFAGGNIGGTIDNISIKEIAPEWTTTDLGNGTGTTWVINDGKASRTSSGGANDWIQQSNILIVGKSYQVTFDLTTTAGSIIVDSQAGPQQFTTTGTHIDTFDATSTIFQFMANDTFRGSIDNISLREILHDSKYFPIFNGNFWDISLGTDGISGSDSTVHLGAYQANHLRDILHYTSSVIIDEVTNAESFGSLHYSDTGSLILNGVFANFNAGAQTIPNWTLQDDGDGFQASTSCRFVQAITGVGVTIILTSTDGTAITYEGIASNTAANGSILGNGNTAFHSSETIEENTLTFKTAVEGVVTGHAGKITIIRSTTNTSNDTITFTQNVGGTAGNTSITVGSNWSNLSSTPSNFSGGTNDHATFSSITNGIKVTIDSTPTNTFEVRVKQNISNKLKLGHKYRVSFEAKTNDENLFVIISTLNSQNIQTNPNSVITNGPAISDSDFTYYQSTFETTYISHTNKRIDTNQSSNDGDLFIHAFLASAAAGDTFEIKNVRIEELGAPSSAFFGGIKNYQTAGIVTSSFYTNNNINGFNLQNDRSVFDLGYKGSLSEVRYYFGELLNHNTLQQHALEPLIYGGNSISSSFDHLVVRYPLSFELDLTLGTTSQVGGTIINPPNSNASNGTVIQGGAVMNTVSTPPFTVAGIPLLQSHHPNTDIDYLDGFTYFDNDNVELLVEEHHLPTPNTIGKSPVNNKIRIDKGTTDDDILSPDILSQLPTSERQVPDFSNIGVFLSPQNEINEDIIYTLGTFSLDEFLGDPREETSETYEDFKPLVDQYFKKLKKGKDRYNIFDFTRWVSFLDHTLFDLIKKFTPQKSIDKTGILIEPHFLERSKFRRYHPTVSNTTYKGNLQEVTQSFHKNNNVSLLDGTLGSAVISYTAFSSSNAHRNYNTFIDVAKALSGSSVWEQGGLNELRPHVLTPRGNFMNSKISKIKSNSINKNKTLKLIDSGLNNLNTQFTFNSGVSGTSNTIVFTGALANKKANVNFRNYTLKKNVKYKLTLTVTNFSGTGASIVPRIIDPNGNSQDFSTITADGTYSEIITITGNTNVLPQINRFYFQSTTTTTCTISNILLEEINPQRDVEFDDGLIDLAGWNNPRYNGSKLTGAKINEYNEGDVTYGLNPVAEQKSAAIYFGKSLIGADEEDNDLVTIRNHSYLDIEKIMLINKYTDEITTIDLKNENYDGINGYIANDLKNGSGFNIELLDDKITHKLRDSYKAKFNQGYLKKIIEHKGINGTGVTAGEGIQAGYINTIESAPSNFSNNSNTQNVFCYGRADNTMNNDTLILKSNPLTRQIWSTKDTFGSLSFNTGSFDFVNSGMQQLGTFINSMLIPIASESQYRLFGTLNLGQKQNQGNYGAPSDSGIKSISTFEIDLEKYEGNDTTNGFEVSSSLYIDGVNRAIHAPNYLLLPIMQGPHNLMTSGIPAVGGNDTGAGENSGVTGVNLKHYWSGDGHKNAIYQLSYLEETNVIIADIDKPSELTNDVGDEGFVIIPKNIDKDIRDNLSFYLDKAGLKPSAGIKKLPLRKL